MKGAHFNIACWNRPRRFSQGLTLLELILVLVIIAALGAMALPKLQRNVENQKAKQALETLKTISQAARLYDLDKKTFPNNLDELEQKGYLDSTEYAKGYDYELLAENQAWYVQAFKEHPPRTIKLFLTDDGTFRDKTVEDSAGFLNENP